MIPYSVMQVSGGWERAAHALLQAFQACEINGLEISGDPWRPTFHIDGVDHAGALDLLAHAGDPDRPLKIICLFERTRRKCQERAGSTKE